MDLVKSSSSADDSFRFHISPIGFDHKPDNDETSNVIVSMSTSAYYNLNTAIEALGEGHPIIPVQLSNYGENGFKVKADYFTSQQLFLFDIDRRTDTEKELIAPSIDEVLQRFKSLGLLPAFWYYTFSHKDTAPKYRVAFICDRKIASLYERRIINECFCEIIGKQHSNQYYVDRQTFNPNRLFYGTDKGVEVLDTAARFTLEQLLKATAEYIFTRENPHCNASRSLRSFASKVKLKYDKDKREFLPDYANVTNPIIDNKNRKRDVGKQRNLLTWIFL